MNDQGESENLYKNKTLFFSYYSLWEIMRNKNNSGSNIINIIKLYDISIVGIDNIDYNSKNTNEMIKKDYNAFIDKIKKDNDLEKRWYLEEYLKVIFYLYFVLNNEVNKTFLKNKYDLFLILVIDLTFFFENMISKIIELLNDNNRKEVKKISTQSLDAIVSFYKAVKLSFKEENTKPFNEFMIVEENDIVKLFLKYKRDKQLEHINALEIIVNKALDFNDIVDSLNVLVYFELKTFKFLNLKYVTRDKKWQKYME